jgi:hypothetical protein
MRASEYGHLETVRTLLKCGADVGAKNSVRNHDDDDDDDDDDCY